MPSSFHLSFFSFPFSFFRKLGLSIFPIACPIGLGWLHIVWITSLYTVQFLRNVKPLKSLMDVKTSNCAY